jgi:hypothetical protein
VVQRVPAVFVFVILEHREVDRILGARHRLPKVWLIGALDQQHLQVGAVDDDEDGFGDFVDGHGSGWDG